MSEPIPRIEAGTTKLFLATYSSQPGTTPLLMIYAGSGTGTLVASLTGVASTSTVYAVPWTLPSTSQLYAYLWVASYTAGPVLFPGLFQGIRTIPG